MLKVYKVHNYVSIDGDDWREVVWSWFIPTKCKTSSELLETEYRLHNASFNEAREYLQSNELDGIGNSSTYWRKKPIVWVRYDDARDIVNYRHFNTISYKTEYKEWTDVSLEWIIKSLPADQTIQYLKERGMTACPILK